ncbi:MAG: nucleoside hydrolase [Clostridia bacterium]|nr:nucleoside hydrolase [Clostridia bacterium]
MTKEQRRKNLEVPTGPIDVVIDTDACNEVDDQFAISYLLKSREKLNTVALYAAPYSWPGKATTQEGMEASYQEILKLLKLAGEEKPAFRGSDRYLPDKDTPVTSEAVRDLCERVESYSPEKPLYILAIGALTNIASALLLSDKVKENAVVVWLGGHGHDLGWTDEFNMRQDLAATRIVMTSGVPFVQIPCECVASTFGISAPELKEYLVGKNPLADYLANNILTAQKNAGEAKWSRILWDVVAVGWLLNDNSRFMLSRVMPTYTPTDDFKYELIDGAPESSYVFWVNRTALMTDLVRKLTE